MDLSQIAASIPIHSGRPLRLHKGLRPSHRGPRRQCLGDQDGDPRDIVLRAGEDFVVERPAATVVSALGGAARSCRAPPHDGVISELRLSRSSSVLRWLAVLLCLLVEPAAAAYPEKPIRFVIPSAPGGSPDVLMRILLAEMSKQMGVSFVIENKPAASYVVGTMDIVRAPADGYTLGYGISCRWRSTNRCWQGALRHRARPDPDFQLRARLQHARGEQQPAGPHSAGADCLRQAQPRPARDGLRGNGTTGHLGGELFKAMTGTYILHVPYRGSAQAINDLVGGQLQLMFDNVPSIGPHVKSGRVRGIAVSGPRRSPVFPDIPTVAEAGVPGYETTAWGGIIGPANLPKDIVAPCAARIRTAYASAAVQERYRNLDTEIDGGTPEQFLALARSETPKWAAGGEALGREDRLKWTGATTWSCATPPSSTARARRVSKPMSAFPRAGSPASERSGKGQGRHRRVGQNRLARIHRCAYARRPPDAFVARHGAQGEPGRDHRGGRKLRHIARAAGAGQSHRAAAAGPAWRVGLVSLSSFSSYMKKLESKPAATNAAAARRPYDAARHHDEAPGRCRISRRNPRDAKTSSRRRSDAGRSAFPRACTTNPARAAPTKKSSRCAARSRRRKRSIAPTCAMRATTSPIR
jgi:tripartite-type tricarboxylate transporter receptor subunit TctC